MYSAIGLHGNDDENDEVPDVEEESFSDASTNHGQTGGAKIETSSVKRNV
jgi:hypothetical protein